MKSQEGNTKGVNEKMKMNQKGNDYFETPPEIFKQLDDIFHFNLDCAANAENAKCARFLNEELDGTVIGWHNNRCFCNPPFSKKAEFIKKAYNEVINKDCPICVMILPLNCIDTKVWHEYIEGKFHYEILKGRIAFIDPETKQPKKGNNSGTVIVYFKKKIKV